MPVVTPGWPHQRVHERQTPPRRPLPEGRRRRTLRVDVGRDV